MLTITALTFKEMLRKRILLIGALLTLAFLALYGIGLHYAGKELIRMGNPLIRFGASSQLLSAGLYFSSFILAFLSIFSAVGTISGEIENGVLHAIVPKPIPRRDIVLGKFLGYGSILAIYAGLLFVAVVTAGRVFLGTPTSFDLAAVGFFVLEPLLLLALTLLGTTLLSTLANGVTMVMLFVVGMVGGLIEQIGVMVKSSSMVSIGIVTSLVMPADSIYRKASAALFADAGSLLPAAQLGPFSSASAPSIWMIVYAGMYLIAALILAVRTFAGRDI